MQHTESDWVLERLHPRKLIWRLCQLLLAPSFLWVALQLLSWSAVTASPSTPIVLDLFTAPAIINHGLFFYTIWNSGVIVWVTFDFARSHSQLPPRLMYLELWKTSARSWPICEQLFSIYICLFPPTHSWVK